jgi:hypothetical protein
MRDISQSNNDTRLLMQMEGQKQQEGSSEKVKDCHKYGMHVLLNLGWNKSICNCVVHDGRIALDRITSPL